MDERQSARAEIDDSRERMREIAGQLARRADPNYVKQRAKEAAVEKSMELKDRIIGSPIALGIIGGLATAGIAKVMMSQQGRGNYGRRPTGYEGGEPRYERYEGGEGYYEGDEPRFGEKAQEVRTQVADKVEAVKEQAGHLKDQAMQRVEHLRERIPSTHDMKEKAQEATARAREYASEEPLITALGALAIGAAFGFLLPLSEPERRVLSPAREQVGAKLESLGNQVTDKVQAKVDDLREKIVSDDRSGSDNPLSGMKFPT
jgi:ElaB/YqjD/DUF883 family membrane-anchored ribosome-binding protein